MAQAGPGVAWHMAVQELALPLDGFAEYVADSAPTAGPYWLEGGEGGGYCHAN